MTHPLSRYSQVTRRAFLGGMSAAAIAGVVGCSSGTTTSATASAAATTTSAATSAATTAASGTSLPASAKATVSWTFAASSSGGPAKNPYMAVWIEDASGAFVKTLVLYHKASGDNWLNTLTRWYQVSGGTDTTTSGTVAAGSFTTTWDGMNASGSRVAQGSYFVCVESVVEHGSESLVRQEVTFGKAAATTNLTPAGEITAAAVAYTV